MNMERWRKVYVLGTSKKIDLTSEIRCVEAIVTEAASLEDTTSHGSARRSLIASKLHPNFYVALDIINAFNAIFPIPNATLCFFRNANKRDK